MGIALLVYIFIMSGLFLRSCGRLTPFTSLQTRARRLIPLLHPDHSRAKGQSNIKDFMMGSLQPFRMRSAQNFLMAITFDRDTIRPRSSPIDDQSAFSSDKGSSTQDRLVENGVDLIEHLHFKYGSKFLRVQSSHFPTCEVYLCGTMHVSNFSTTMVEDAISSLRPRVVVIELCPDRAESLGVEENPSQSITLSEVVSEAWKTRNIVTLGTGMLMWMQGKAAQLLGNKLGGELHAAAKEAHKVGAMVVLGDRLYDVTIQRIFDKLRLFEKLKAAVFMVWEVLTMSLNGMRDYISKSDSDDAFVQDEIQRFTKYFPGLADIIINERDEYLAQSILEVARELTLQHLGGTNTPVLNRIVVVVGAGHLVGIQKCLQNGGVSPQRIRDISASSKHSCTWPPSGSFRTVDLEMVYGSTK